MCGVGIGLSAIALLCKRRSLSDEPRTFEDWDAKDFCTNTVALLVFDAEQLRPSISGGIPIVVYSEYNVLLVTDAEHSTLLTDIQDLSGCI